MWGEARGPGRRHGHGLSKPPMTILSMKIALLADTHGRPLEALLRPLLSEKPDLLIHAGDIADDHRICDGGRIADAYSRAAQTQCFLADWNTAADQLNCPIVMVAGNHDFFLAHASPERHAPWYDGPDWDFDQVQRPTQTAPGWVPPEIAAQLDPRIKILNGSGVRVKGLCLWGSPWTPHFGNWAYNFAPAINGGYADAMKHWAQIPADTDILITHGPPRGILDDIPGPKLVGCPFLRAQLDAGRRKPKLHVFGHIHGARGQLRHDGTLFVNAAMGWGERSGVMVVEI